jgi:23S rRNA (pseudouridine1915-N3)-methyltransferase
MIIRVLALGETEKGFIRDGLTEYQNRLRHYCRIEWVELDNRKILKFGDRDRVMAAEEDLVRKSLNSRNLLWLLDERGKQSTSEEFAQQLGKASLSAQGIDMVIGGPFGHSASLKADAVQLLSLSALTFTHQMVRVILAEQLYRAFTILKGEGYHH